VSDLHATGRRSTPSSAKPPAGYDQVLCCGDLVGYGAEPNSGGGLGCAPIASWWCGVITTRSPPARRIWNGSTRVARAAALWTQQKPDAREISSTSAAFPKGPGSAGRLQVLHGSPFDEDEYVMAAVEAGQAFGLPREPPGLFRAHPRAGRLHLEPLACGKPSRQHPRAAAGRRWRSTPSAATW